MCFAFAAVRYVDGHWLLEICSTHSAHGSAESGTLGERDALPGRDNAAKPLVQKLLAGAGGNTRQALAALRRSQPASSQGISAEKFTRIARTVQNELTGLAAQRAIVKELSCQESFLMFAEEHPGSFEKHVLAAKFVGAPEVVLDAHGDPVEVAADCSYIFVASTFSIALLLRANVLIGDMLFKGL